MPRYKNELAQAKDALIEMGGVKIYRSKNSSLDDIIKGLTIDLISKNNENVQIDVSIDTETPNNSIKELLTAYNQFLELSSGLQKNSSEKKTGNYKRQKRESGILLGDSTLGRLVSDLKMFSSSAYPATREKGIKILYQIGISTGKIRESFASIKKGHLKIIDSDKLDRELKENYLAVKEFFGSDTNHDKRINNGFAFRLSDYIKSYTKSGKYGLITSKIQLADDTIELIKKNKEKREHHVEQYKQRLRRSFAAMEKGMLKTKNEQRWLNSQMGNMGGSSGKNN